MTLFNARYRAVLGGLGYDRAFDFDGNGVIDSADLLVLRRRLGITLP